MSVKEPKPIQGSLRDAAKSPDQWDVPGLLSDAADNLDVFEAFVRSLLNPEENGRAVNAYVRDEARRLLGMEQVETKGTAR